MNRSKLGFGLFFLALGVSGILNGLFSLGSILIGSVVITFAFPKK